MKKIVNISIFINVYFISFILIFFTFSCKKETSKETRGETAPMASAEIDVQKIEDLTGVQFKILKTETHGYMPLYKFYWIALEEKADDQKVEELAHKIIEETIAVRPKTYHSFTIHFFLEDDLAESVEESECYARATFLPEGSRLKVGRVPIDDYKSYKLTCTFFN